MNGEFGRSTTWLVQITSITCYQTVRLQTHFITASNKRAALIQLLSKDHETRRWLLGVIARYTAETSDLSLGSSVVNSQVRQFLDQSQIGNPANQCLEGRIKQYLTTATPDQLEQMCQQYQEGLVEILWLFDKYKLQLLPKLHPVTHDQNSLYPELFSLEPLDLDQTYTLVLPD